MDANETHREHFLRELRKNATSYFAQLLEATPHETTALPSLTTHLTKSSENDEQDMRDTDGEVRMNS